MKVVFKHNSNLFVFTFGTSLNAKIAGNGELIGQHFTFSRQQFELAKGSPSMSDFFRADGTNCLDCPFSGNQSDKAGLCYTHKFGQFRGFLSSLRSIHRLHTWETIPQYSEDIHAKILTAAAGKYFRFGSYGEPSLIPVNLIADITAVAKLFTGYSHQWQKFPDLSAYFMASTHNLQELEQAEKLGFRSYMAGDFTLTELVNGLVNCPASAEAGKKSHCSKCGLCSGTTGKGNKSVYINLH